MGSVRHGGFIPWDDDIDVGMPRSDYNKFIKIASEELPGNMFLQTFFTDEQYPCAFAKIRNNDTTFIEKGLRKSNINHGIYICVVEEQNKSKIHFLLRNILRVFAISIYFNTEKAKTKMENFLQKNSYNGSEFVINYCGAWGKKEIMPKSYFGNGTKGTFEGMEVILPEKYDEYLTKLYGDYMTLPPPEKRVGHHYYTVLDTEKSYRGYNYETIR